MRSVKIDGEKLRKALTQKSIDFASVSRKLGCSKSYISDCIRRNTISMQSLNMLSMIYGIGIEDLQEENPKKPEKAKLDLFGEEELYKTIYSAVYNAMKDALKED